MLQCLRVATSTGWLPCALAPCSGLASTASRPGLRQLTQQLTTGLVSHSTLVVHSLVLHTGKCQSTASGDSRHVQPAMCHAMTLLQTLLTAAVFSPVQVTHEPHFCLLREVVSFSGGSRGRPSREVLENPCQESFILFQIGLLREYLELEFRNDALPFAYDVERVIDDFVLFCMLIGNDFLPGVTGSLLVTPCYVMAFIMSCRQYQLLTTQVKLETCITFYGDISGIESTSRHDQSPLCCCELMHTAQSHAVAAPSPCLKVQGHCNDTTDTLSRRHCRCQQSLAHNMSSDSYSQYTQADGDSLLWNFPLCWCEPW